MWLPNQIIKSVDDVANIYYIDLAATKRWNANRDDSELRLLTGWCWTEKGTGKHRQGFKTITVAYRDAWYELVARRAAPMTRRLRLVRSA